MRVTFFILLWLLTTAYVMLRGGPEERKASAMFFAMCAIGVAEALYGRRRIAHLDLLEAAVDCAMFAGCLALAFGSRRRWPLYFAAAQAIAVLGHMLHFALPPTLIRSYLVMIVSPSYMQCLILIFATMATHRLRASPLCR